MNPDISLPQLPANLDPALRDYLFAWQKLITSKQLDDYSANKSVDKKADALDKKADALEARLAQIEGMHGVGSIYISINNVNPSTWMTGTTWEAYGQGRTLIGAGTGTDSRSESKTFTEGQTGGEYNHLLTPTETALRNHAHAGYGGLGFIYAGSSYLIQSGSGYGMTQASETGGITVGEQNAITAHNNMQPYLTVYMWKRTA